ncbi:MAG: MFS transporter [Pseudomonadota bacterium]|uniref:MFS transporter n=1 Tax=Gallaecimonas pentaromativorans TaxID=584787 RepID=UPI00067F1BCA|nr:MFS transporter [Gallaecimonas pentaromativorans]MED5524858.1 MFS transporter [Pseudomonadota bacterium]
MKPFTRHQWAVLSVVLASYLLIILDISIVVTGLPQIRDTLGFSHTGLSWVQNAYTLTFGGLLLLGARAGDLLGRKRLFLIGLSLFILSSFAIGLAQSPAFLISARAVQGIGAAVLAPSTLALLSVSFGEGEQRVKALSFYAATAGIGSTLGLVLGGFFAGWLSWRVGFFINVPLGLLLLWFAYRALDETPVHTGQFDALGSISSTLGMGALVFGIEFAADHGWQMPAVKASLSVGTLLLAFFAYHESRTEHPLLPLRLFASRERLGAYIGRMLFVGAMVSFFFFSTQLLQGVMHFSPIQAGFAFMPITLATFVASVTVPRLTRRFGNNAVLLSALLLLILGMGVLSLAGPHSHYLSAVALPMVLIGLGNGAALGPLTIAGVAKVASRDAGAASGLVNAAHQLGGTLGLSVLVVVFAGAGTSANPVVRLGQRLSACFEGATVMLLLALVFIVLLTLLPRLAGRQQDASQLDT